MKTYEIQDKYNPSKIWIIKETECNHFYVNQKINGKLIYPKFQRMRKKDIEEIGLKLNNN